MPDNMPPFNGALSGVKVVDCTQIMAGPFCTLLLADMGADVIKVEKPNGGDDARRLGPPFIQDWSAAFLAVNRNKRSIALDLRTEEGQTGLSEVGGRGRRGGGKLPSGRHGTAGPGI